MKELTKYLDCAAVCSTHGVRGTVRLENRCDTPQILAGLKRVYAKSGDGWKEYKVLHASVQKNMVLASLEGVDTVEAAASMRGIVLYASREDLDPGEGKVFIADMIGLDVIDDVSGQVYGKLKDVIRPGAQQIYIVKKEDGEFMIPAVPEFVKEVSLGENRAEGVYVRLIEGMAD